MTFEEFACEPLTLALQTSMADGLSLSPAIFFGVDLPTSEKRLTPSSKSRSRLLAKLNRITQCHQANFHLAQG
jgi:hypothetical protein